MPNYVVTLTDSTSPAYSSGDTFRVDLYTSSPDAFVETIATASFSSIKAPAEFAFSAAYDANSAIKVQHVSGSTTTCIGTISNGVALPQSVVAWEVFGPTGSIEDACAQTEANDTLYTTTLDQPFDSAEPFYTSANIALGFDISGGWFKHIASGIVMYIDSDGEGYDNQLFNEEDTVNEGTETPGPGQSGDSC